MSHTLHGMSRYLLEEFFYLIGMYVSNPFLVKYEKIAPDFVQVSKVQT